MFKLPESASVRVPIEPLAGPLRDPRLCKGKSIGQYLLSREYLSFDRWATATAARPFTAQCTADGTLDNETAEFTPRRSIYFDVGASTYTSGLGGPSQVKKYAGIELVVVSARCDRKYQVPSTHPRPCQYAFVRPQGCVFFGFQGSLVTLLLSVHLIGAAFRMPVGIGSDVARITEALVSVVVLYAQVYFVDGMIDRCAPPSAIYAWEMKATNSASVWAAIPGYLKPLYHWYNIPASPEEGVVGAVWGSAVCPWCLHMLTLVHIAHVYAYEHRNASS